MLNTVILTSVAYAGDEPAAYLILMMASIAGAAAFLQKLSEEMEERKRED